MNAPQLRRLLATAANPDAHADAHADDVVGIEAETPAVPPSLLEPLHLQRIQDTAIPPERQRVGTGVLASYCSRPARANLRTSGSIR
jgi:hypothetical protein